MSQENVELVKSFTSQFEAVDRNVWRDYFDPRWFGRRPRHYSLGGIYHGYEGVNDSSASGWSLDGLQDGGPRIHRCRQFGCDGFRQGGIGRDSGVRTQRDFFGVYDLSDSKVIRYRQYESRKEALEAVGLSE